MDEQHDSSSSTSLRLVEPGHYRLQFVLEFERHLDIQSVATAVLQLDIEAFSPASLSQRRALVAFHSPNRDYLGTWRQVDNIHTSAFSPSPLSVRLCTHGC